MKQQKHEAEFFFGTERVKVLLYFLSFFFLKKKVEIVEERYESYPVLLIKMNSYNSTRIESLRKAIRMS